MKLSICITHYDEDTSIVKELLDSINIQQNIDFSEIEAIIVNDGGDFSQLSKIRRRDYMFPIHMFKAEHSGLSSTRNKAFAHAKGDYVMFCDVDDMFYTVTALRLIFKIIDTRPFDALISSFMEEIHLPDGRIAYYQHPIDCTFVHGKVYRRQFLIDNDIKYDPAVGRHQDSPFMRLVLAVCDKSNLREVKLPFYLWRWRDNSICRRDGKYSILNSETSFIDGVNSSVNELLSRDKRKEAAYAVAHLTYKLYFLLNSSQFLDKENEKYRIATERRFKEFYDKFEYLLEDVPSNMKNILIRKYKADAVSRYGVILEKITFDDWMNHLKAL